MVMGSFQATSFPLIQPAIEATLKFMPPDCAPLKEPLDILSYRFANEPDVFIKDPAHVNLAYFALTMSSLFTNLPICVPEVYDVKSKVRADILLRAAVPMFKNGELSPDERPHSANARDLMPDSLSALLLNGPLHVFHDQLAWIALYSYPNLLRSPGLNIDKFYHEALFKQDDFVSFRTLCFMLGAMEMNYKVAGTPLAVELKNYMFGNSAVTPKCSSKMREHIGLALREHYRRHPPEVADIHIQDLTDAVNSVHKDGFATLNHIFGAIGALALAGDKNAMRALGELTRASPYATRRSAAGRLLLQFAKGGHSTNAAQMAEPHIQRWAQEEVSLSGSVLDLMMFF